MRLVVNATAYGDPPGGAGLRARHLFGALKGHDLLFLLAGDTPAWIAPEGAEVRRLPVRAGRPFDRWRRLDLPAEGDLLFTDHYPAGPVPTVITLHDAGGPWWRRALIRRHLRGAAAVVAVSGAVRDAWGVDAVVVPNGVPAALCERAVPEPGRHLLLVDPGPPHKGAETARGAARALGLELREVGRGARWLPQDELWDEMARAAAVLCPSREEGFGMVALEALALGRPVVCADLPAFRETCGDAAVYAEPGAWEAAVASALEDADAAKRRARARERTWERAAARLEEWLAAYPAATV